MRHEQPVIEYAPPPPKRPSRVDRLLTFVLGWMFGVMGFLLVMAPVNWLFGRIQANGKVMADVAVTGVFCCLVGAAFGRRWNRLHRRPK
jgi:hypothetical protein